MKSSVPSAASRRPAFGVLSTGLPAMVSSARTWPGPGVSISSASAATGSSPNDLGQPAHAAGVPRGPRAPAAPRGARRVPRPGGGRREHRAARPVEVARERVEDVDEPARGGAEALRRRADPPVDHGAVGGGEVAGEPADGVGVDAAALRGVLRGAAERELAHRVDPGDVGRGVAEVDEVLGDEHVDHGQQQEGVGPGPDGDVLVGLLRGPRAARVDDDDPPAAGPDRAQAPAHVGRGHEAPVGGHRVGPEHEQVVRAVEVGERHREAGAEQVRDGQLLGLLVDGAGREEVLRAQRLEQEPPVEQRGEVVGRAGCRCRRPRRRGRARPRAAAAAAGSPRTPRPRSPRGAPRRGP